MKGFLPVLSACLVTTMIFVSSVQGAYPADPTADIAWLLSCGYAGIASIQCAFNNARSVENTQLGTSLPVLTLPAQATWDAMSNGEKALWLINRERSDRWVNPLTDVETNVTGVAQTYAQYLLDNDAWSHTADGRTPWQRLEDNPDIGACHDFLSVAENLAAFAASGGSIPLHVERSLYMWMYEDTAASWGHRHTIVWYPYNDNSGSSGTEGFLGIGRASGSWQSYPVAEIMVMNVFDQLGFSRIYIPPKPLIINWRYILKLETLYLTKCQSVDIPSPVKDGEVLVFVRCQRLMLKGLEIHHLRMYLESNPPRFGRLEGGA